MWPFWRSCCYHDNTCSKMHSSQEHSRTSPQIRTLGRQIIDPKNRKSTSNKFTLTMWTHPKWRAPLVYNTHVCTELLNALFSLKIRHTYQSQVTSPQNRHFSAMKITIMHTIWNTTEIPMCVMLLHRLLQEIRKECDQDSMYVSSDEEQPANQMADVTVITDDDFKKMLQMHKLKRKMNEVSDLSNSWNNVYLCEWFLIDQFWASSERFGDKAKSWLQ